MRKFDLMVKTRPVWSLGGAPGTVTLAPKEPPMKPRLKIDASHPNRLFAGFEFCSTS